MSRISGPMISGKFSKGTEK